MTRSTHTSPDSSSSLPDTATLPGFEGVPPSEIETIHAAARAAFRNHVYREDERVSVDPTPALEPLGAWLDAVIRPGESDERGHHSGRLGRWCAKFGLPPSVFFHVTGVVRERTLEVAAEVDAQTEFGLSGICVALEERLQRGLSQLVDAYLEELETSNARRQRDVADGLAHEVRNPLNAAALNLTLLERLLRRTSETSEDLRRSLANIRTSLRRMDASTRAVARNDNTAG